MTTAHVAGRAGSDTMSQMMRVLNHIKGEGSSETFFEFTEIEKLVQSCFLLSLSLFLGLVVQHTRS